MRKDVSVVIGVGGMGVAIARRIGSGRALLLADRNEEALAGIAALLGGEGHDVTSQVVDVSDVASMAALAEGARALGSVSRIAHTAGLSPVQAPTDAILAVDLLGVAVMLEVFAGVVAPGGAGVVIASMAGHMAQPPSPELEHALATTPASALLDLPALAPGTVGDPGSAYVLAKQANVVRVRAAAATWGQRAARINSISPGIISTPMGQAELAGPTGEIMQSMIEMSATKRVGTPDDIAGAAAFLLGPDASFLTGTDLLVDGGVVAAVRSAQPGA